jgi:hypothetical protein
MKRRSAIYVGTTLLCLAPLARGGHELPVYPSYYPHEIAITTTAPQQAIEMLRMGKMHAFAGKGLDILDSSTAPIGAVESLGSFVVIRLNADATLAHRPASACAAIGALLRSMTERGSTFVLHPYPVTPYHGDYLYHADLAEAAKARFLGHADGAADLGRPLRVKVDSPFARSLVGPEWLAEDGRWDAAIEQIDVRELISSAIFMTNAWLAPPAMRSGWLHAYRLLADSVDETDAQQQIKADFERLDHVRYDNHVARINLERHLVKALTAGCRAVVAGYTVEREYFNAEFSAGIENIGYDALMGLDSPMFLRTVKLKDFPWNGWLQLGIGSRPEAAWNPIAGFNDAYGRLMWFAIADPAVIPAPYDSGWMLNRFSDVSAMPQP